MANEFPHKHIIGYVHIAPDLTTDTLVSNTDHSTYTVNSLFGVFAKNGRQAIDVCAETGTTYINGVDPVASYAYAYTAIPTLENIINEKLSNYVKEHDVFHYGGILIPSTTKGGIGTFSYLTVNSMVIVGTTVKVQNDGWFGNYHVHAGDLLIAYSDDATTSSTALWDIVETHLGPLNSKGTYTQANKPNFLTNIYLNDNGDLSYSYSYFTQVHSYVNNKEKTDIDKNDIVVVSNVNFDASGKFSYVLHNLTNTRTHHSIEGTDAKNTTDSPKQVLTHLAFSNTGHLSYIYKELGLNGEHIDNKNLEQNGEFNVINNVWQDGDGNLSYTYSTIVFKGEHHKSTGQKTADTTFGGYDTEIRVITNTYIDSHGSLSYTYADLKYNEQHHTQGASHKESEITFGKDENDENYVYVLTGVNLSTDGTLTYSYRPLSWEEDHHDNKGKQQDSITFEKNDESVKVITNVNLGSKGELSYTYLTLSFNDEHHGTIENPAPGFVDAVYLTSEGTLSYHITAFEVNTPTSASKTHNIRNTSNGALDVVTGISIDSDTGKISYQYKTISYNLTEDHHTTTPNNAKGFIDEVYLDEGGNLSYSKQKFEIEGTDRGDTDLSTSTQDVITGISVNEDTGKIDYSYKTLSTSHSSNGSVGIANAPYFLNNVHLNDNGVLTYAWSEFKTETSPKTETSQTITYVHLDGTGKLTYVANILSADSSSYGSYNLDGNSYVNVVTGITQRGDGKLSYSTTTLKHHHGTTKNSANGFVSDVYLSDNGQLSYAKTAFEVNTPTSAAQKHNIRNTSKGELDVLVGLSIHEDTGKISYQYKTISYDLTEAHHSSTGTKALNGENFLTNVKISETGEITYTYYPFSSTKSTNTASLENSGSLDVISSVNLSQGNLSYTVTSVSNINKHHTNKTGVAQTTVTLGDQNNEVVNVVSNLKISSTGELSYTYTPVKISYNHHRIGTVTELDLETFGGDENHDNEIKPITGISVSADGAISYTYAPTKWNEKHHTTTTNSSNGFVSDVYLDAYGNLSYAKTAFAVNTPTSAAKTYNIRTHSSGTFYVIAGISINQDSGEISYQYNTISYDLTHTSTGTAKTNLTFGNGGTDSTRVITNVNLSETGQLTYDYLTLSESQSHHSNAGTAKTDLTFGNGGTDSTRVITNVNLSETGNLTYDYLTLKESQSHHGGNVTASTYYFVEKVELSSTGTLSGSTYHTVANSNKIYVAPKNTSGSYFIPFFDGAGTEYKTTYIDSNLYYNPSTDTLYVSKINGQMTGDATGGVTGSFKGAMYTATSNSSYTYAIPFLSKRDANGFSYAYVDSKNSLTWNPNTDTISLKNINATGNTTVEGYLNNKTNITTTGYVKSATLHTTGNALVAGYLNNNTNITTTGYVKSATLQTTGNAAIGGYLNVTGNETINGYLTVKGNETVNGYLNVDGDETISGYISTQKYIKTPVIYALGTGDGTGRHGIVFGVERSEEYLDDENNHNNNHNACIYGKDQFNLHYSGNSHEFTGDVTINGKLSITDSTKVDNLTADMLDGMHISGIDNKYWGTVTYVKSGDGVMEIGKYIDFHYADGEADYSTRVSSQNTSTKNTITLPSNDGTLHVGDFIKSDAGDKELDATTASSNGLKVLTGLSFDTTTGKVSYCTHDIYHGNSGVTAGTFGLDSAKTYALDSCKFFVPEFTVNAQGHITAASEKLITISPNTVDVASKTHTHTLTPSGSISGSSHNHTFNMVNGTSSKNGSHNHTFTGNEVTTSSISGTKSFYQITGVGSVPTREQVTVASSGHTHKITATGDVNVELNQTSTATGKPDSTNITSVATGAHTHTTVGNGKHTPSGTVTSTFTGVEVANHSHTTSGTAASAGAHTHTLSGTSSSNGAHTHTISGTSSSNGAHTHTTSGTAASAGAHTHTLSGTSSSNGAHTHTISGTSSSNGAHTHKTSGTAASAGAHTHTSRDTLTASEANGILTITFTAKATTSSGAHTHKTSGTAASAGAHTHTYSATTSSAGAHTHTYSATTSSAGAHTHTTSGTAADAGKHTHTYSATTSSAGAHTHTYSATTSSAGAHTHTTSGTAADAGKHTPSGTVTSTFAGNEVAAHTHTINATGTGNRVNMPNANHTHNYYKATVKSASFTGNEVTTSSISGTTSLYQITGVGSVPTMEQITVASSDHTHKLTAAGTISNNGAHTHTYTYISSINNAAPTLTFTGTSAITTSTPSATTTVVIK